MNDRCLGAFLGLAVGDALGAPVEFSRPGTFPLIQGYRDGGPFNLPEGYWTDDTSMALCLADSLIAKGGFIDLNDQMERYWDWYSHGTNSSTGKCFDIGEGTVKALENFKANGLNYNPSSSEGNGSLMRLAPIPIVFAKGSRTKVGEACLRSSSGTHNHYASCLAGIFGKLLHKAINGLDKSHIRTSMVDYSDPKTIGNSGHAPESLKAALWHFHSTSTFRDAALQAVNRGGDSDTIGAITGQIAGAYYGYSQIPREWISGLYDSKNLIKKARKLISLQNVHKP